MEDGIVYVFGQLNTMVMVFDGLAFLYSSGNTFFAGGTGLGLGIAATMAAIINILMSFGSYTTENKLNMHGPLIGLSMYALIAIPTVDRMFVQDIYSGTTVAVEDVPLGIAAVAQISSTLFFYTAEYFEDAFDNSSMHGTAFVSKVTTGNGFMSPLKTLMYLRQESMNVTPKHLVYNIVTYSKDCIGRSQENGTSTSRYDHNLFNTSVDPFRSVFLDPDYIEAGLYVQQLNIDGTSAFVNCGQLNVYLNADETTPGSIDNYFTDATSYGRSLLNKLAMANEEELSACSNSAAACSTAASAITKTEDIVAQVAGGNAQAKEYMKVAMANDFNMMITSANALNSQSTADVVSSMRYSIELTRASEAMEGEMFLHFMMKALNGFLAVVYALFPIAMIIMVLQGIKATTYFGKYIIMVFWLQSWVPVAAVINYISISNLRDAMKAIEDTTGFTIGSSDAVYQAAMDAVVTGSNLLAATPLISLVILTGSYFALTSAASGTASPSGGSGAAARMSTPAPHGGSPVLSMASQYSDVTGTGGSVVSTPNMMNANKYSSSDSSSQSSQQTAAQAQQIQKTAVLENSMSSVVSSVQSEISSQGSNYSYSSLTSDAQSVISAGSQNYTAQTGRENDVSTRDGAQTALNWSLGAGTVGVANVLSSDSGGGEGGQSNSSAIPIVSTALETFGGPEGIVAGEALETVAAEEGASEVSGGGSGNSGGGRLLATGHISGAGNYNESTSVDNGTSTRSGVNASDTQTASRAAENSDSTATQVGTSGSTQVSNGNSNSQLQSALSSLSDASSDLQSFTQQNASTLESSRGYNVTDGEAYALAKSRLYDQGNGNPGATLSDSQSNGVYNAAMSAGYSEESASALKDSFNEYRGEKADERGLKGSDGQAIAGITSLSSYGNNNPEHAEVMQAAQSSFDQTLHPGREQAVDTKSNNDTIEAAQANTKNDLPSQTQSLNQPSGVQSSNQGQQTALNGSDRFEQRFDNPSQDRASDAAANGEAMQVPTSGLGGDIMATQNAKADYANGGTLGESFFSDGAKDKFSQAVHGKDFAELSNGEKAGVSDTLNKAALGQVDNFLNSMQSENSPNKSDLREDYRLATMGTDTSQGNVSGILDSQAGGLISQAANTHTAKEEVTANAAETSDKVANKHATDNNDVISSGTENNANLLTSEQFQGLSETASSIQQEYPDDTTAQQTAWNEHVGGGDFSANPAMQSALTIPSDDAHAARTPMAQLNQAQELAGGEFSPPATNMPDALVNAVSNVASNTADQFESISNSIGDLAVDATSGQVGGYTPNESGEYLSTFSQSPDDGFISSAFTGGANTVVNGINGAISSVDSAIAKPINAGVDIVNSGLQSTNSAVSNVASSLRTEASPGTVRSTQDATRDNISSEYQQMNLSEPQQQQFNESFNQNLSNITGSQSSIDLNKPLDVGQVNATSPTQLSDAFVATKNDFANDKK